MILSPRRQTFELNGGGSVSIGSNGNSSVSSTTSSGNHHSNSSSSRLGNGASFANSGSRVRVNSTITFSEAVSSHPVDEEYRMPYRDRKLSESVVSLTHVVEEEENLTHSTLLSNDQENFASPSSPSSVQWPGASALPMARSTSQRRISQEINLRGTGLSSPRTPSILDENRNAIGITPIRHHGVPARRNSGRSSNGLATPRNPVRSMSVGGVSVPAMNKTADDYFSVRSDDGFSEVASSSAATTTSQRVPFPRSMSTSGTFSSDSPSARRIGRHLSLSAAQSTESIDEIPISPRFADLVPATPRSSAASATGGSRKSHFRYSSDLHIARPNFTSSRSEVSFDQSSRSRFGSEVGSLYANTLDDSASMSGVKHTRDPSAKQSKHRLILTEEGKADVTLQLGNCIGRGQFGSVYRALNLNTGQMVAVKRIKLNNRSEDEVTQLMHEVELLKSLVHPSVVKYEGLARGEDVVSIVLEYVENGSLLHTLKAFGNFPEKLVASYVVKILEGLNYLHEMKVVHCDLKAANILTTKNGNVKLSDFGVSLNLKAAEDLKKNDAIGTPNWMAPEVIELKGASTAADIWSLGCTIIELLTGKPPYGDMLAMSAMWRIVEDDCPPLPKNISDTLHEFLTHCFQKDPALRPSAAMLCEHAWLRTTWGDHKALRPQDSVPFFKRIASGDQRKGSIRKSTLENGGTLERKGTAGRNRQATVTQADVLSCLPARNSEPTAITETIKNEMERSTSSPSAGASLRPQLHNIRASSAPDAWSAKPIKEVTFSEDEEEPNKSQATFYSPARASTALSVSPPAMMPSESMCRRGSDVTSTNTSLDLLRSPSTMAGMEKERSVLGDGIPLDPSMLDLTSPTNDVFMLDEQASLNKTHAFVKSTFSKPVLCKICRDSVKKHAVLCEDCGLICHASCAKKAITPCNLRAQLLMLANHRSSLDMTRVMSPTPSASTPPPPTPTSMASPTIFRFPFGKYKRNSKAGASDLNLPATLSASPRTALIEADPIVLPDISKSPPLTPMSPEHNIQRKKEVEDENKRQKRPRRISLLPSHLMRQRSPSPSPLVGKPIIISPTPIEVPSHEHNRTSDSSNGMIRSPSSSQSVHDDSIGYGSSASSMSSSFQLGSPTSQMSSAGRSQFPSIEIRAMGNNKSPQPSSHDVPTSRAALQANRRQRHLSASAAALSIGSTPNFTHHSSNSNGTKASDGQPKTPVRHASHGLPWYRGQYSTSGGFSVDEGEIMDRSMGAAALALAKGSNLDQRLPTNHHDVRGEKKHNRRLSSKQDCIIA